MNLNKATSNVLRVGIYLGMALIAVGLAMDMMGMGTDVIYAGLVLLIASPFLGILTSFVALLTEKDWFWAAVAAVLIAVTSAGILISF